MALLRPAMPFRPTDDCARATFDVLRKKRLRSPVFD
jgi:hypothetical protein